MEESEVWPRVLFPRCRVPRQLLHAGTLPVCDSGLYQPLRTLGAGDPALLLPSWHGTDLLPVTVLL